MSALDPNTVADSSAPVSICQPQNPGQAQFGSTAAAGDITPTDQQAAALREVKGWFKNRTSRQQVFRLFGYAGTGKTTITRLAIEELGLPIRMAVGSDGVSGGAIFGAYTGKAALVMSRHGTPASTIHSMCYRLKRPNEADTVQLRDQIKEIEARLAALPSGTRGVDQARLVALTQQLANSYVPRFALNPESVLRDVDLIVLDEVSMVGPRMARDLLSFGKPILVLGDPGQLPPIHASGYFVAAEPDVMLEEIHRQARDSAIIRLATMARRGEPIPYSKFDDEGLVSKVTVRKRTPEALLRADQVICALNRTRRHLNVAMRLADGLTEPLPTGERDKVIVLRNRSDLGVVNGQFITLTDVIVEGAKSISALIRTDDGTQIVGIDGKPARLPIYTGHFLDHVRYDPNRELHDYHDKEGLVEADWGNAITCHKAQGSQWQNVIVCDELPGRTPGGHRRWLYTAITRAERGLWIYA